MANRISGITIEIEGDTTKLSDALKDIDKSLRSTQTELKDVNKLLKLDPNNTQLLSQKQELLSKAIADTKSKLDEEKAALAALKASPEAEKTAEQQRALEREIIATTQSLEDYTNQQKETDDQLKSLNSEIDENTDSLKENQVQASQTSSKLEEIGNTAQTVADKTRALSMAALGFGTALVGNAYKSAQAADDLNTLAKQTGFSVEELQKMQYASDLVDVSMDTMTGSIKKLTSKMSSGADVFDTLGVSIYDANGNMRDATDVWYDSIEALSKVENETERDALSMELFGKSAMDMAGIVDDGGAALRSAGEEAEELGLILDQDALTSANEFNDAIDRLKATATASFRKAGTTLATALVPVLEKLASVVTKVTTWFGNLTQTQQKTILTVVALVAAISPLASAIAGIIKTVNTLKTVWTTLSTAFTAFSGPVGIVIAAIAALVAIGITLYKNWDTIKAKAQELGQNIANAWNNVKAKTSEAWNNVSSTVSSAVSRVKENAVNGFNNVRDSISNVVGNIKSVFSSVTYALTHPFETARNTIQGIVDRIKGIFNFQWSLPHIKLPHFSVTTGFLGLPKISVSWYAKAMKNGMILNNPTIFGAMGGQLLGGGEAGSETIVGTNSLMGMIQQAVGNRPVINMTVNANGMNADELSSIVVDKITRQITRTNQRW